MTINVCLSVCTVWKSHCRTGILINCLRDCADYYFSCYLFFPTHCCVRSRSQPAFVPLGLGPDIKSTRASLIAYSINVMCSYSLMFDVFRFAMVYILLVSLFSFVSLFLTLQYAFTYYYMYSFQIINVCSSYRVSASFSAVSVWTPFIPLLQFQLCSSYTAVSSLLAFNSYSVISHDHLCLAYCSKAKPFCMSALSLPNMTITQYVRMYRVLVLLSACLLCRCLIWPLQYVRMYRVLVLLCHM